MYNLLSNQENQNDIILYPTIGEKTTFNKSISMDTGKGKHISGNNIIGNNHFAEKFGKRYEYWYMYTMQVDNLTPAKVNLIHI